MKLLHVVGARPNFPKVAPVFRAGVAAGLQQAVVHTGQHYDDALSSYEDLKGSCGKVKDADSAVAAALAKCEKRSKAQKTVMAATAAGMKDWKNHQKLMQANKEHQAGTPAEAQAEWLQQYHAAPKNIKAFKKATADFKAPSC